MNRRDRGMTILEVVIAFTILSIGIGFMFMSNKAYYTFREDRQERQQMLFYAAGQMEAYLEGREEERYTSPPFDKYEVEFLNEDDPTYPEYLEIIQIEVSNLTSEDSTPVSIYTYRVKTP